jgi:subfamily B ATP-binding cassette protein MsbA
VHLFNDTVANNIAYARTEEYSREQIEEAARMAYAMDFINKMDNGLDTIIGENGVCSPAASASVLLSPVRCCVTARS